MIECDFCGAVTRVIENRCMACGRPTLQDWPDDYDRAQIICRTEANQLTLGETKAYSK